MTYVYQIDSKDITRNTPLTQSPLSLKSKCKMHKIQANSLVPNQRRRQTKQTLCRDPSHVSGGK